MTKNEVLEAQIYYKKKLSKLACNEIEQKISTLTDFVVSSVLEQRNPSLLREDSTLNSVQLYKAKGYDVYWDLIGELRNVVAKHAPELLIKG
jgi:hypothetical protein